MLEHTEKNIAPVRSHQPILTVDYQNIDNNSGYGDALFLDIGLSTWNKEDLSAKVWRWTDNGQRWSRQSEELPLFRVLDLAILVAAAATQKTSMLSEFYQRDDQKDFLHNFIMENMQDLATRFDELRRILQPSAPQITETNSPNIFSFASSELSQDAMFAWLLSWAKPQCKLLDLELYATALRFVKLVTGVDDIEVETIDVGRHKKDIDVWAEINSDIFLVIEDKTSTTIHDEQLEKYKKIADNEYSCYKKYFTYIKTGNEPESILQEVRKSGYRVITRKKILDCLEKYPGNNVLICSYREHLQVLENETQSFKTKTVFQWSWSAWEGFYKELEKNGIIDDWKYVPNPSGGFLGAWWHWKSFNIGDMYLQFEQQKLCFKIHPTVDKSLRSEIRNKCSNALLEIAKDCPFEVCKPARFGAGEYMTIAVIDPKYIFGNEAIDLEAVIKKLKICEKLVDQCCAILN